MVHTFDPSIWEAEADLFKASLVYVDTSMTAKAIK